MSNTINTLYCFDDVLLVPRYSDITSRKDISLAQNIRGLNTPSTLPIISSPMDTVTGANMAVALSKAGGLGVLHRYNSIEGQVGMVYDALELGAKSVACAIGVSGDYLDRAKAVASAGARVLCVDVAHGHHTLMKKALSELRLTFGNNIHIMAGNVATLEAFNDLADWGADSIRVGIGGGSICSTRIQTGHGMPTLASVMDCAKSDRDALLIADGGIRNSGDITKALAAGADFVMIGSLLAGTDESPGDVIERVAVSGPSSKLTKFKVYRGMASVEAQVDWRGRASSIEGVSTVVPYKGPVSDILHVLEKGIRSGLSYSGAKTLLEFRTVSRFICQTSSGATESSTHILNSS